MNAITRWTLMALLAVPHLAQAEIYKWVDERGVTTYGNKPPRGVAGITRMNDAESRVSIVPAPRSRLPEATRGREPEARIARFEGDAGPAGFAAVPLPGLATEAGRRERCFSEHRVDCAAPTAATYDVTPSFSPYR